VSLTPKDIAEITRLLEDSSFDELELQIEGLKIHLRRAAAAPAADASAAASGDTVAMPLPAQADAAATRSNDPHLVEVRAPLLGTFYRAPKPGAPSFVEVGGRVESDTIVGIIEVMKLMNTVRAGVNGVVREVCARDGALVEYGATLLRVDTREPG